MRRRFGRGVRQEPRVQAARTLPLGGRRLPGQDGRRLPPVRDLQGVWALPDQRPQLRGALERRLSRLAPVLELRSMRFFPGPLRGAFGRRLRGIVGVQDLGSLCSQGRRMRRRCRRMSPVQAVRHRRQVHAPEGRMRGWLGRRLRVVGSLPRRCRVQGRRRGSLRQGRDRQPTAGRCGFGYGGGCLCRGRGASLAPVAVPVHQLYRRRPLHVALRRVRGCHGPGLPPRSRLPPGGQVRSQRGTLRGRAALTRAMSSRHRMCRARKMRGPRPVLHRGE